MSNDIHYHGDIAYVEGAEAMVYFKPNATATPSGGNYGSPTATQITKLVTALDVAPWGEDNRFPQNIENALQTCGVGKSNLDWQARQLWGQGIMPVKVVDYEMTAAGTLTEILAPLKRSEAGNKVIFKFIEDRRFSRFYLEFLRDWKWYWNCFPELILSNDGKQVTGIVHQESCDVRYKQMNDRGVIDTVYISKLWGLAKDQYVKFNAESTIKGIIANPATLREVDNKYIKALRCIDMYDDLADLRRAADELVQQNKKYKSVILPVNYPSANKTYYQLPDWDTARRVGWMDIVAKVPAIVMAVYNNAFRIRYHIEVPEKYFERRLGTEVWKGMKTEEKRAERAKVLGEMNNFLKGAEKSEAALVTFFDYNEHNGNEVNRVKVTEIQNKSNMDKELLTAATANTEISIAMGVNPDVTGSSMGGTAFGGNKGGSNLREGKLVNDSGLHLERTNILAPLLLAHQFNGWDEDIQYRWVSSKLTTLDQGKGTEKVVS